MAPSKHVLTNDGEPIWRLGVAELVRGFSEGRFSPVDALEAVLARSAAVNPGINAVVTFDLSGAREAAQASAVRWRAGKPKSSIDGVPISVKDNIPVAGIRSTWGSRLFEDFVPVRDELPIARLREAGAAIFGKANVPEFTLQGYTDNAVFGATRNPWQTELTPGGSSGGAVAAVAAGIGPAAIGTDGGGSIRRPAAYTGLVGMKPSTGRVARTDGFPIILHDFEVIGPIARSVSDAGLLLSVMAGPDPRDRSSHYHQPFELDVTRDPQALRLLYIPRFGTAPVDPEIAAGVDQVARNLTSLGHHIAVGEVPFEEAAFGAVWSVVCQAGLAWLLRDRQKWREAMSPDLVAMAEAGAQLPAADYVAALDEVRALRETLGITFQDYDLILTPTTAAMPWAATESYPRLIDCREAGPRGHAVFTGFANAAGLPGINLPAPPSPSGLPIGFQLVGSFGADALLLQVAAQYERAYPFADRHPELW